MYVSDDFPQTETDPLDQSLQAQRYVSVWHPGHFLHKHIFGLQSYLPIRDCAGVLEAEKAVEIVMSADSTNS
jgi:hypothetical protein